MVPPIAALITPEQELHGPGPLNVPGWEFKTGEVNNVSLTGKIVSVKVNPNLYTRRLFAYMWVVTQVSGFTTSKIDVLFKGSAILSIPFNFGNAAFSATQFSQGTLLGSGSVPTPGSLQLTLSTPFNGSETSPVYAYPMDLRGLIDEIKLTFFGSTGGAPTGRLWLGCISQ